MLLDQFKGDPAATWKFSKALLQFRLRGDDSRARQNLKDAIKSNEHVGPMLLGDGQLPEMMPAYGEIGGEDDAVECAVLSRESWANTPGALNWLRTAITAKAGRERQQVHRLLQTCMDSAREYQAEGRLSKAKGQLQHALRHAEKFGEDEYLWQTLQRLSLVLVKMGVKSEDEQHFFRSLRLAEILYEEEDSRFILSLFQFASFKLESGHLAEAEDLFSRAASLAEQTGDTAALAAILSGQSELYKVQGKFALAREHREKGRQLFEQIADSNERAYDGDD